MAEASTPVSAFLSSLDQYRLAFEGPFLSSVSQTFQKESVTELHDPSLYSLEAGGKRIRPVLVLLCADLQISDLSSLTGENREPFLTAAAIECIHTYSLIHDDLPPMDDDDMRRGRPSCHRRYPQWAALLAGDVLNTFAFRLLADAGGAIAMKLRLLADAAGHAGMAAGQALDLSREKADFPFTGSQISPASMQERSVRVPVIGDARIEGLLSPLMTSAQGRELLAIHLQKTGALIRVSCEMGALCRMTGKPDRPEAAGQFAAYGNGLGLLFQIADDLLDVVGDAARLGKATGKDQALGKLTFPGLLGLDRSLELASQLADVLRDRARVLPLCAANRLLLEELVGYVLERDH